MSGSPASFIVHRSILGSRFCGSRFWQNRYSLIRNKAVVLTAEIAQRIVDRVASSLDKRLSVADATGRVLASTDAGLVGRRLPDVEQVVTIGERAQVGAQSPSGMCLPLVYLDQVVGAIVLDDTSPQGREIVRVAKTLAELIIYQMVVIEHLPQQAWVRDKFISDLLHEHLHGSPEVMLQEAALLGIDLRVPRIVALIDITPIVEPRMRRAMSNDSLPRITHAQRLTQIHTQLLDRIHTVVATDDADIYSFIDDHRMILLAAVDPVSSDLRKQQLAHDLQRFLDLLAASESGATSAGIGWYHDGWPALAQSYIEAQFALKAGAHLYGAGHVYQAEDLGLAGFVCSDDRVLKAGLTRRLLQPLAGEPELLTTLEAFLHANLSPSATAQTLHIHRHTLAYRLEKIAQLTGHDPRIFATAAQFSAALIVQHAGYLDD
jgi:carbohydrate diacid regulator